MSLDLFDIDFSDIPDQAPLPAGMYAAEVVAATPGQSKSGNPKVDLQWRIMSGEFENRRVFSHLSLHPNALGVTKAMLLALGFPKDFAGVLDTEDLIGRSASIVVAVEASTQINPETNEPYPPRAVVKRVKPLQMGDADLDDLI